MTNRLAQETSPYLQQHAENPVDWYPWGPEAFEKARREDKPIFLSVGYSACHWCHVMERESFEDRITAELLERDFVSVKVDREERPDVDAIYMDAVQAMTGRGGWPMSVFLTPDGQPFYGGTYYPNESRFGMPAFNDVLARIAEAWRLRRAEIAESGAELAVALEAERRMGALGTGSVLTSATLAMAERGLASSFDREYAGFGDAPKFPQPMVLEFLLRRHLETGDPRTLMMVTATLDAMARGGIYDQLGGGFHRYAVDERWLVPHFEKMLYDNAQLARIYLHAWQVTGDPLYQRVATETLDYVVREMTDPSGGFYSSQDADSERVEGRFFVWTPKELSAVLGEQDARVFAEAYGVSEAGNFEGSSVLHVSEGEIADLDTRLAPARSALFAAREQRVRPGRDEKVIASWNGLMLSAFAEAARVFEREDYREVAVASATFILSALRTSEGRMLRTWRAGQAKLNGYLEDYATVAEGLLQLYQSTFDERWFIAARELGDRMLEHFIDPAGGLFDTSDDHESLLMRPKAAQEGAQPSGGSVAATVLLQLAAYTGEREYAEEARTALGHVQTAAASAPLGFASWLQALDFALAPPKEVAIVGERSSALVDAVRAVYRPSAVVAASVETSETRVPLLAERHPIDSMPAAYVCQHFACSAPITDPARLQAVLDE